jgi:hypothetical protein
MNLPFSKIAFANFILNLTGLAEKIGKMEECLREKAVKIKKLY